MSLAENIDFLRRLPRPGDWSTVGRGLRRELESPLVEMFGFGSNPGNLRMFAFVPTKLQRPPALVVVLHGCGQTAAAYDLGAGWSTLAKRYGFALLLPQQQPVNNAHGCFNWFNEDDIARGRGEACSIRQMVSRMLRDHAIDPRRVFVTGLSAGGAMTSVMLATYPDVFAAGAIIAGLPYGTAANVREALTAMRLGRTRPAHELGDLVRSASKHRRAFPRVSVWHGSADRTVNSANATEIVKQWLDVHRLPEPPMSETVVDGHARRIWWDADGETVVESYTVANLGHGTPLGLAEDDKRYGRQGPFLLEAGISSSYHIAKFFGLTGWIRDTKPSFADSPSAKLIPSVSPVAPRPPPETAEVPRRERRAPVAGPIKPKVKAKKRRALHHVGAAISRALMAAGLMK